VLRLIKDLNYNGSNFFKYQDEVRKEIVANDFSTELWPPCHSYSNNSSATLRIFNPDNAMDFIRKEIRQNSSEAHEQRKKLISEISI
jgi:hypothetical protein